jgi:hypothetical protein
MTIASGAAVFLFIASALVINVTFLAGSGAPTTALSAPEVARDAAGNTVASKGAQPASSPVPAPSTSPQAGFALGPNGPTASASDAVRAPAGAEASASPDDARVRADLATAGPSGAPAAAAYNPPQDTERSVAAAPQRSPLLNPWLWLGIAIVCAAAAIALQRRLRASV